MAIDRTGISSLDTGASDITYSGNEGPKSPAVKEMEMAGMMDEISLAFEQQHGYDISLANPEDRENFIQLWKEENFYDRSRAPVQDREGIQMASAADPMLEEQYQQYVFEMQEQGIQPMSFEQFRQQAVADMATGGRAGYRGGQLVKNNSDGSRPGYQGWGPGAGSPGTPSGGMGGGGGGGGGHHRDDPVTQTARPYQPPTRSRQESEAAEAAAVVEAAEAQAAEVAAAQAEEVQNEINRIEKHPKIPESTKKKLISNIIDQPMLGDTGGSMDYMGSTMPAHLGDTGRSMDDMGSTMPAHLGDTGGSMDYMGSTMPAHLGDTGGSMDYMGSTMPAHLGDTGGSMDYMTSVPPPRDDGGDGGGGLGDQGIMSAPIGTAAADTGTDFAEAKEAAIAEAAASGAPFEHYYVGGAPTPEQEKFMQEHEAAASMVGKEAWPAAYGGRTPAAFGGIMGDDGRRAYGLGSIFKKAFKAIKKVAKSPVGMAALTAFGLPALGKFGAAKGWAGFGPESFLSTLGRGGWKTALMGAAERGGGSMIPGHGTGKAWSKAIPSLWDRIKGNPMKSIGLLSMLPFLTQGKGGGGGGGDMDYGPKLDLLGIRKKILAKEGTREEFPYLDPSYYAPAAQGGRIGYQDGRSVRSIALNQLYGIAPKRKMAQEGGLMDLGGMEKDYRQEGGFVPIGGQERADDVPARLSKNEFVFTADAVRSAGGGDIDKGAEVMENVMNNLEQGGQVSEDSQGLEGARNMFATAQRLEGVL